MLLSLAATLAVVLPSQPASFAALRSEAEPLRNVGRFLEETLGDCASEDPEFDRAGCEAQAGEARKRLKGRVYRFEVEDPEAVLRFAGWDAKREAFRLHFTPIFGERGLAMSVGKPTSLNKDGLPVVKNRPIWLPLPSGQPRAIFQQELERAHVRVELLFRLGPAWSMPGPRKQAAVRGLEVELLGLRVYSRAGQLLAEETYR